MGASIIHVEPGRGGRWFVREDGESAPRSEHSNTTEAERVAWRAGATVVLVHDRYARVHPVPPTAAQRGPSRAARPGTA